MTLLLKFIDSVFNLLKGLSVTLKNLFRPATTLQYPKEKQPMAERYRGLVDLRVDKCIMCLQCVKICPVNCLEVKYDKSEDNKKSLTGFTYNFQTCCFCGLCEQVCPTSAIFLNKLYEISMYNRKNLLIDLTKGYSGAEFLLSVSK